MLSQPFVSVGRRDHVLRERERGKMQSSAMEHVRKGGEEEGVEGGWEGGGGGGGGFCVF